MTRMTSIYYDIEKELPPASPRILSIVYNKFFRHYHPLPVNTCRVCLYVTTSAYAHYDVRLNVQKVKKRKKKKW